MKGIKQVINDGLKNSLVEYYIINEAWGATKHYKSDIEKIFADYDKKKNAKPKQSRYGYFKEPKAAEAVFAKYPMQIIVDKAGYEPKKIQKFVPGRTGGYKESFDEADYGKFIVDQIEAGKLSKEDMLTWWNEYETEVMKAKWHDPKFIAKQIDPVRCWNVYYPKDDSVVNAIIAEPAKCIWYLKNGNGLTYDEKKELRDFLADPVNQDSLNAAFKGVKNTIMKARPTFQQGAVQHLKSLIDNCDYSDGDLKDLIEKEYKDRHKSYYQGGNERNCEASAVIGLIMKVINKIYGFEVWSSINGTKDEYDNEIIDATINGLNADDQTYEQFVDDADSLKFIIKKLKMSDKKDKGSVHSSSFTNNYNYDFEVICKKNDEEIFHDTITDVTVGSYFYSGGW